MVELELGSMFVLGLLSTGHCLGMCGPLILAIPASQGKFVSHLGYHAGRLITYTLIGGIIGGIGGALMGAGQDASGTLASVKRIEVFMMLFSAVVLLVFGLVRIGLMREPDWLTSASPSKIPAFGKLVARVSKSQNPIAMIPFGLLMGLLPCGILYAAFAKSLSSGGVFSGALTIIAFGIGTTPGLLVLGGAASRISLKFRRISDIASSILLVLMAVWIGFKALKMLV